MGKYSIANYAKDFEGQSKVTDCAGLTNYYDRVLFDRGGLDIFEHVIRDTQVNPEPYNMWHGAAEKAGMAAANKFLNTMYQSTPDGEQKMKDFITKFNSDQNNVKEYYVNEARRMMGAKEHVLKNMAHENNIFSKLRFKTESDYRLKDKLSALLNLKWRAVGYTGDNALIDAFINEHPFSVDPRPHFVDSKNGNVEIDPWFNFARPSAADVMRRNIK